MNRILKYDLISLITYALLVTFGIINVYSPDHGLTNGDTYRFRGASSTSGTYNNPLGINPSNSLIYSLISLSFSALINIILRYINSKC